MDLKHSFKNFPIAAKMFFAKISKQDLLTQSAALSYYCALSLAPLMVLFLSLLSFVGPESKAEFVNQIRLILGSQASEAIKLIIEGSKSSQHLRSLSEMVSFAVLLFSASSVFSQLKNTLTIVFSVEEAKTEETTAWQDVKNWLKERVFSIGIMVSFIFISVVSLLFSVFLSVILPSGEGFFWQFITQILNIFVYGIIFYLVFYYIPNKKVEKKDALIGGVTCSVMFIVGKGLLSVYLGGAAVSSAYGASGSLIALLIWVYYSSFIVFASAVITSIIPKIRKISKERKEKVELSRISSENN